eukprot:2499808-Alexandrium_andersonii.AAC.1
MGQHEVFPPTTPILQGSSEAASASAVRSSLQPGGASPRTYKCLRPATGLHHSSTTSFIM